MRMTRRSFLLAGGLAGGGLIGVGFFRGAWPGRARAALEGQPLAVPPLLDARARDGSLELTVQQGSTAFFPGVPSPTLGYNGSYLGPTLRVHSGDEVAMTVINRMEWPTTVHWHGLLVPGELDGGPHQEIAPGATWRPRLSVRQPAATLIYHSHVHGATAEQVYYGLAGVLLVTDEAERALGLPSEYGVDDLPLVLQDRAFVDGQMVLPSGMMAWMHGRRGNVQLVNGTVNPVARVPARRVRLRLVNASNARVYELAFEDRRAFHWIASEGGLLDAPVELRSLLLAPGQRAEILVDFSDSAPVALWTGPDRNFPMMGMIGRMRGVGGGPEPVIAFAPGKREGKPAPVPKRLAEFSPAEPSRAVRRRRFLLQMGMGGMMGGMMGRQGGIFAINGQPFDLSRVDERVRVGDTEIWEVSGAMMGHPFHIHGVQFQVLSRMGRKPTALDRGVRDTVMVREPVELLVRFTQPSNGSPYMYHCHILEHEEGGMMAQFAAE